MAFGDIVGNSSASTDVLTDPFSPSSGILVSVGDLIFVNVVEESEFVSSTTCTDNLGNSFSIVTGVDDPVVKAYYSIVTIAGTSTPAVANTVGNAAVIICVAYQGPFSAGPLDKHPAFNVDTVSPYGAPSTGTLSQTNELIIGYFGTFIDESYNLPGPSARLDKQQANSSTASIAGCITSLVAASTSAVTMTVNGDQSTYTVANVATFKADPSQTISAQFAGSSSLRANTVQSSTTSIAVRFAGSANLSVNNQMASQMAAQFAGSGNLSPFAYTPSITFASCTFIGAGQLTVTYLTRHLAAAIFEGSSDFRIYSRQGNNASARFGGAGDYIVRTTISITDLFATVMWPDILPQCPILNGFSEQKQRNLVSFKPDVGPSKIRRRSSESGFNASVIFRMTSTELAAFNTFFIDTLEDGSIPFIWRHPTDGLNYSWWFDSKQSPRLDRMTPDTFRISFSILRFGRGRAI